MVSVALVTVAATVVRVVAAVTVPLVRTEAIFPPTADPAKRAATAELAVAVVTRTVERTATAVREVPAVSVLRAEPDSMPRPLVQRAEMVVMVAPPVVVALVVWREPEVLVAPLVRTESPDCPVLVVPVVPVAIRPTAPTVATAVLVVTAARVVPAVLAVIRRAAPVAMAELVARRPRRAVVPAVLVVLR